MRHFGTFDGYFRQEQTQQLPAAQLEDSLTVAARATQATPTKVLLAASKALDAELAAMEAAGVQRAAADTASTPSKPAFAAAAVLAAATQALDGQDFAAAEAEKENRPEALRARFVNRSPSDSVVSPVTKQLSRRREDVMAASAKLRLNERLCTGLPTFRIRTLARDLRTPS